MSPPPATKLPRHPAIAVYRRLFGVVVGLGLVLSSCSVLGGSVVGALPLLGLVALAFVLMRALEANAEGVLHLNAAFQRVSRGELDDAEAHLDRIPARGMWAAVPRGAAILRTMIALQRGKPEDALARAALADRPVGLLMRGHLNAQRAALLSLRALARAALGDHARALADAEASEALEEAAPDALARARLVRALVLSRESKLDELSVIMRDDATLLLDHGTPRDRTLTRALQRMSRVAARSVYREPARRADDAVKSDLSDWVAALAPEAAAFVDEPRALGERADLGELPPASIAEVGAIDTVRAKASRDTRRWSRVVALWTALVVMLLGIWQFLAPSEIHRPGESAPPPPPPETFLESYWPLLAFFAVAPLVVVGRLKMEHRSYLALARAHRAAALGDVGAAQKSLWSLVTKAGLVGPSAQYELARIANREARFLDAVSFAEAALARLARSGLRASAHDILMPGLLAELALAKAALGRADESAAELAVLHRDFPGYAHLASATLRVRLVQAARGGDRALAAAVSAARTPEIAMTRAEELLADLAAAAALPANDDERQRLAAELAEPKLARWIDAVAPRLKSAATDAAVRVAASPAPAPAADDDDDAAEDDAAAVALRVRS